MFNDRVRQRGRLEIDLMANSLNAKWPQYLSPFPDPQAVGYNALSCDWNRQFQIYIFPPKWLISTVITKLQSYRHHGLIILPGYKAELWYPYVQNRSHAQWGLHLTDPMRNGRPASEKWPAFSF